MGKPFNPALCSTMVLHKAVCWKVVLANKQWHASELAIKKKKKKKKKTWYTAHANFCGVNTPTYNSLFQTTKGLTTALKISEYLTIGSSKLV